jgi:hypothetical protein
MAIPIALAVPIIEVIAKGIDLAIQVFKNKFPEKAQKLEELKLQRLDLTNRILAEKRKNPSDQNDALIENLMIEEDKIDEEIKIYQDSASVELTRLLNAK